MPEEKNQEECNNQRQNSDLLDHWPKWSLNKHEAEVSCHEHRINPERMSHVSITVHEANAQNELKLEHSQTDSKYEQREQYQAL